MQCFILKVLIVKREFIEKNNVKLKLLDKNRKGNNIEGKNIN